MSDTDSDLDRLQDLLTAVPPERDGMNVVELDGYVAALIVCPDPILSSEWLPGVWGEDHAFSNTAEAEATIGAVMGHYNRIARDLAERPEDYVPVLGIDPDSGETLWEPWIDGFERAMRLRPDVWEEIALSDDEEASASISMVIALYDFYCGRSELTEAAEDELDRLAPEMIPDFVRNLNAWTKSRRGGHTGRFRMSAEFARFPMVKIPLSKTPDHAYRWTHREIREPAGLSAAGGLEPGTQLRHRACRPVDQRRNTALERMAFAGPTNPPSPCPATSACTCRRLDQQTRQDLLVQEALPA